MLNHKLTFISFVSDSKFDESVFVFCQAEGALSTLTGEEPLEPASGVCVCVCVIGSPLTRHLKAF